MQMKQRFKAFARSAGLALAVAAAYPAATQAAAPPPAQPQDNGPTASDSVQTVSLILKVQNQALLDAFVAATSTPGSDGFHHFLSVGQFRDAFAPSANDLARLTAYLGRFGISVTEVYDDHLVVKASGTAAQFNQAFSVTLHDFTDSQGHRWHRPDHTPCIGAEVQDLILYVAGLDTETSSFHPMTRRVGAGATDPEQTPAPVVLPKNNTATGVPGSFTVGDVANLYNINPLYRQGDFAQGRTIGIATLANFTPSDAYSYWSQIGLNVDPNRIAQVHVDGGGQLGDAAGSIETTLDVEQSGGLAPAANIVVYDAPNTDAGFLDVFYKLVSDNKADTFSVSWGSAELYNFPGPLTTDTRAELIAFHQIFAEAAAQGQSAFASSGDDGAYDTSSDYPQPQFTTPLAVDSPASDPYIVAAGGTTVPASIQRKYGVVVVPTEQVWGWDYFNNYLVTNYGPSYLNYYFSVGGGGGVSSFWDRPFYQQGVAGMRSTEPNQVWSWYPNYPDTTVQQQLVALPAHFRGRNVPDVSLNADPYTGYLIFYEGGWVGGYGGTSFVAPQLNGITALLQNVAGGRLGLLQPRLYAPQGWFGGNGKSTRDITAGDNWFYQGIPGYEPGAGIGVLDVAKFANTLH